MRQKARWIHGIALQGWERLGWIGPAGRNLDGAARPARAADSGGAGRCLSVAGGRGRARRGAAGGLAGALAPSPLLRFMIALSFASFAWRAVMRFAFTAREYGVVEGLISQSCAFRSPMSLRSWPGGARWWPISARWAATRSAGTRPAMAAIPLRSAQQAAAGDEAGLLPARPAADRAGAVAGRLGLGAGDDVGSGGSSRGESA